MIRADNGNEWKDVRLIGREMEVKIYHDRSGPGTFTQRILVVTNLIVQGDRYAWTARDCA